MINRSAHWRIQDLGDSADATRGGKPVVAGHNQAAKLNLFAAMRLQVSISLALGLAGVAYGRPRFLQQPENSQFVCKYSTPPDIIPLTPDETPPPSSAPTPAPDCIPNIEIISDDGTPGFDYPPIQILSYEGDEVLFSASQTWSEKTLCQVAVDYSAASADGDMVCDPHAGVAPGEVGVYRAVCVDGFTTITVYAQDDIFKPHGNAISVPDRCGTIEPGPSTITHTIKIPCVMEPGCPLNEPPVCDGSEDMVVSELESFEDGNVKGWLYGSPGEQDGNGFLIPGTETAKNFWVPVEADALVISFTALELTCDSQMVIRLDDSLIELGSAFDCEELDTYKGYAGDVYIESTPLSETENEVTLTIPSGWFDNTGRLVVGFVATTVGIDDFEVTSVCSGPVSFPPLETDTPTSSPTSPDCVPDIVFVSGSPSDFAYPPITILAYEDDEVVFAVSQTWSDKTLCQVAIDYSSASEGGNMVCDPYSAVPPGEVGTYRAVCVNGFATITTYAQDDIFKPRGNAVSVPGRCGSIAPGPSTVTHTIKIPCKLAPSCPTNIPPVCDGSEDMVVVEEETFDDGDVKGWMFAEAGEEDGNGFLGPVPEMSRTFAVPTEADAVVVTFKILEIGCNGQIVLRVGDSLIELGSEFDCEEDDSHAGYAGDIWVQLTALSETENEVQLIIPADWFVDSGRLTIGFAAMSNVAIDDFMMTSDCSGSIEWPQPPTMAPTGDCIPNIEFESGSETDFEYPPIEIISYEGDEVVFSASQAWTEDTLCLVAVDYSAASKNGEMTCDPHSGVAPGEFGLYRAVCVDGFAHINVFAQDDFFDETTLNVPARCAPLSGGAHTHSYSIIIPCNLEPGCPAPEEAVCSGSGNHRVAFEDFESDEASSWQHGEEGAVAGKSFLFASKETSKTFSVPKDAPSLTISFHVVELEEESAVHFRIEDHILDLGDLSEAHGFFGDVQMTASNDFVELKVPSEWYSASGRLTVGFIDSPVGVDEFAIDAACV